MFEEIRRCHELQKANILRGFGITSVEELEFAKGEIEYDELEKAVYADTAENRKLGRVGQEYKRGKGKKEDESPRQSMRRQASEINEEVNKHRDKKIEEKLWFTVNSRGDLIYNDNSEATEFRNKLQEKYNNWNNLSSEEKSEVKELERKYSDKYKEAKAYWDKITAKRNEIIDNNNSKSSANFDDYAYENLNSVYQIDRLSDNYEKNKDREGYKNFNEYLTDYYQNGDGKNEVKKIKDAVKKFGAEKVRKYIQNSYKEEFGNNGKMYYAPLLREAGILGKKK